MKLVFASDSFKGSLSSERICSLLESAAGQTLPGAECVALRMADGGEGTLDAISAVRDEYKSIPLYVHDGFMFPTRAKILVNGDEAFVEAASACGLATPSERKRNPLIATSHGVGECVLHALYHDCRRITIGLGGTCTNDGGMGFLRALGFRFFAADGHELKGNGADLARVSAIDESGVHEIVREASFTIMCDVTNPLLGPNGATYVFGRQKGADDIALEQLEAGMANFAEVISQTHPNVSFSTPGFGAAGGLGMALSVFLGAKMCSGIEALLKWVDFDALISDADLVVTGEGQLDEQSLQGKVISGITAHAGRAGVPVAAICGRITLSEELLSAIGLTYAIDASAGQPLDQAMAHAEENYLAAARSLFANALFTHNLR